MAGRLVDIDIVKDNRANPINYVTKINYTYSITITHIQTNHNEQIIKTVIKYICKRIQHTNMTQDYNNETNIYY
jgi:hypothetical protein